MTLNHVEQKKAQPVRQLRRDEFEPWLRARQEEADEAHKQGWRRWNLHEDLQASVPDAWLRTRRRHRWLR
jgi:hypothetical protein